MPAVTSSVSLSRSDKIFSFNLSKSSAAVLLSGENSVSWNNDPSKSDRFQRFQTRPPKTPDIAKTGHAGTSTFDGTGDSSHADIVVAHPLP